MFTAASWRRIIQAPAAYRGFIYKLFRLPAIPKPFHTDFCSPKAKLIIELDDSQHLEQQEYDEERTKYLEARGYRVLRFWNNDVTNNTEAVLRAIRSALNEEWEK